MAAEVITSSSQVHEACDQLNQSFMTLMQAHKEMRESDMPQSGNEWKQLGLIESLLSTVVRQLVAYDGTRSLATSAIKSYGSVDSAVQAVAAEIDKRRSSYPRVGIFDRGVAWEKKRNEVLEKLRQEKLESEVKPPPPRRQSSQWDHVQSVMRRERLAEEEAQRKAEAEAARIAAEEAKARAELAARAAVESDIYAQAKKEDALIEAEIRRRAEEAARRKAEAARKAREAKEREEADRLRRQREVIEAFGEKGLEKRPSMPTKFVLRVSSPSGLSGNVMHEYRVKDTITKTKGISFVMGQTLDSNDDVVQAILFDKEKFDEHAAAVWWKDNEHRFAVHQRKAAAAARSALSMGKSPSQALAAAGKAVIQQNKHNRHDPAE